MAKGYKFATVKGVKINVHNFVTEATNLSTTGFLPFVIGYEAVLKGNLTATVT